MKYQFYFSSYVDAILVAKGDTSQFFWETIAWTVKYSVTKPPRFLEVVVLTF